MQFILIVYTLALTNRGVVCYTVYRLNKILFDHSSFFSLLPHTTCPGVSHPPGYIRNVRMKSARINQN